MPSGWLWLRRSATLVLTLLACLALSIRPVAETSSEPAQQNAVVASIERYAKGDFDAAVKQLIGTKKVSSVLGTFRKDANAWIDRAPEAERAQRISVTGAMSVELLAATFDQHRDEYVKTREIIEWACERFRRLPPSEVERHFYLVGIALAQAVGGKRFIDGYGQRFMPLGSHHEHPLERFPREARFKLAIATANPEVTFITTWPLPPGYLVTGDTWKIDYAEETPIMDSSIQILTELFNDPAVGAEARLRSGVLRFLRDDVAVAQTDLSHAEQADDPAVKSVAQLMLGAIADQAGDSKEALRRYWLAWGAAPSATASIALASRMFRSNAAGDAANVLRLFESSNPPPDPWELYGQRDFRAFTVLRNELRRSVARLTQPLESAVSPATPRPASFTMTPARTGAAEARVAVLVQSGGEPVLDLKAEDFSLMDSGVQQTITAVEGETKALDVTVVAQEVTTTRSGKNQTLGPEIASVSKAMTPADRLTVMFAGRDPRPVTPPGSRDLLHEAALERRCVPVYDTLARALMKPPAPDRQNVVIVVASGEGRGGFLATKPVAEIARRASARVYVANVEPFLRGNYIAEAVCPEVALDFSKDRQSRLRYVMTGDSRGTSGSMRLFQQDQKNRLVAISESTGGREIRSSVLRDNAIGPLREVLDESRSAYILRYTPKGVADTGWHPITIKVTRPGNYDIRVRPGYER